MRLARLSLAAAALIALSACSNDATAPEGLLNQPGKRVIGSSGPSLNTGLFGSGMKTASDTVFAVTNGTTESSSVPQ
jgi:hypothetical protein